MLVWQIFQCRNLHRASSSPRLLQSTLRVARGEGHHVGAGNESSKIHATPLRGMTMRWWALRHTTRLRPTRLGWLVHLTVLLEALCDLYDCSRLFPPVAQPLYNRRFASRA